MAETKKVYKARLKSIQEFTLLDDTFAAKCIEDPKCAQLVLRIVLGKPGIRLKSVWTQKEIRNLHGRSIRLDAGAVDTDGTEYCLEVERRSGRAIPKRARYNGSLLDANITEPGESTRTCKKQL